MHIQSRLQCKNVGFSNTDLPFNLCAVQMSSLQEMQGAVSKLADCHRLMQLAPA